MDEQKEPLVNSTSFEPVAEPIPEIEIPTLRTYKGDISHTVNKDKITTAKILIAEQKRSEVVKEKNEETSIKRPTNILVLILGIILLIGAVGLVGYFGYTKIIKKTFEPIQIPDSFLFIFDDEKSIEVTQNKVEVFSAVEKSIQETLEMKNETYVDLVFFKKDLETKENVRITSAEFFELYDIVLPTNISRSIAQDFVYGMYKTGNTVEPFLVIGLVDYENMYSSMFLWETTLALDIKEVFPVLKNLFDISKKPTATISPEIALTSTSSIVATSTKATTTKSTTKATSTSQIGTSTAKEISPEEQYQNQKEAREVINRTIKFTDLVFSNRDVRATRDPKGNPFFYYGFINRDKIIFAQDSKLIGEISRKIKEKSLVR